MLCAQGGESTVAKGGRSRFGDLMRVCGTSGLGFIDKMIEGLGFRDEVLRCKLVATLRFRLCVLNGSCVVHCGLKGHSPP